MAFLLTSAFLALAYIFFMSRMLTGFKAYEETDLPKANIHLPISIVIPFRDEEANLSELFKALDALDYPTTALEVILVDDHSTDAGLETASTWISETKLNVRLLKSSGRGKKDAQRMGIYEAKNELIACTDADCLPAQNWLNSINAVFSSVQIKLAFGPVAFSNSTHAFQRIEFVALIASTMAMLKIGWPVMGNGANMAFRKAAYLEAEEQMQKWKTPSGDDIFLLHALAKEKNAVGILPGQASLVTTSGSSSLWAFIQQRLRWASKARHVSNRMAFLVGGLIFTVNTFLLLAMILFAIGVTDHWPFALLFLVKFNLDFIFIKRSAPFFNEVAPSSTILIQEVINIIYVPLTGLLSQLLPYTWKGRRY